MEKLDMLYEGKAKKVYATSDPQSCIVFYKDDATAFNGLKKASIGGKGIINNKVSNFFMSMLEQNGVHTHLIQQLSDVETLVKKVSIIPLEVIIRNVAAGSLSAKLGLPEGKQLSNPILEFCYKNDQLGDPMVNEYHIYALELASNEDLATLKTLSFKINDILVPFLKKKNIELIDFKLEFGKTCDGEIILADEISPDTCRFWDSTTKEKLDKDRFRRDLGNVQEAYTEILHRLGLN